MNRLNKVLIAPYLSEKSLALKAASNVHVFKVRTDANKIEIKQAVELHFNVKVSAVRTVKVLPTTRRVGKHLGKTSAFKKAYVSIVSNSGEIEYFEGT